MVSGNCEKNLFEKFFDVNQTLYRDIACGLRTTQFIIIKQELFKQKLILYWIRMQYNSLYVLMFIYLLNFICISSIKCFEIIQINWNLEIHHIYISVPIHCFVTFGILSSSFSKTHSPAIQVE